MKIGILSNFIDDIFLKNFPYKYSFIKLTTDKYDGFFIDWVPRFQNEEFLVQCALIEIHKNTVPIVIFDRFMSLSQEEVKWLSKYMNVFLFEPALIHRYGFQYLPTWITDFSILKNNYDRKDNLIRFSELHDNVDFADINYILADCQSDYKIGYLNKKIFDIMNKGCIPLLPIDHKYFNTLFHGLIVKSKTDLELYISGYHRVNVPIIEEIFDNLKKYYPEFLVENAISRISECLRE